MDKNSLRKAALAVRKKAAAKAPDAGRRAAAQLLAAIRLKPGAVVSLYWPMRSELDTGHLFDLLDWAGHPTALPVLDAAGEPLTFRIWKNGDALGEAAFGTREPVASAAVAVPDVVVTPMLAYDNAGYRLGYGGGFYDRTLAGLRGAGEVLAVGFAYAAQEVPNLPIDEHDEKLDWLVTEKMVREFS